MGEVADSARQLEAWSDDVMACIRAQDELDSALLAALGRRPSLREETLARMADAVRAAACGLGPAGCAVAAGVPERLLLAWQERDPAFAAAMEAASVLARAYAAGVDEQPPLVPSVLRVMLKAVSAGVQHAPAASLVGVSVRTLYRLRREHPGLDALVLAARRARPKKTARRPGAVHGHRFRLIRVDDLPSGGMAKEAKDS